MKIFDFHGKFSVEVLLRFEFVSRFFVYVVTEMCFRDGGYGDL